MRPLSVQEAHIPRLCMMVFKFVVFVAFRDELVVFRCGKASNAFLAGSDYQWGYQ